MSGVQHIEVVAEDEGVRLDRWFRRRYPTLTQGRLEKLLRKGQVRINGGRANSNDRLEEGQIVRIPPMGDLSTRAPKKTQNISPEDIAYMRALVVHRDRSCLVLNKPSGLAVQGGTKTERHIDGMLGTLKFEYDERPNLVHRLDRDTSGVLVLARSTYAAAKLGRAFKHKNARKIYWALTVGVPRPARGTIRLPLAKLGGHSNERVYPAEPGNDKAKTAVTHYAVVAHAGQKLGWVAFMPVTGRTHQIRAHAAYALGTPVVGDGKYGGVQAYPGGEIPRQMHLHARSLCIAHPDGDELQTQCDLPPHMLASWKLLNFDPKNDEDIFSELTS